MGGRALDFYAEAIVGWRSWTLRPDGCVVGLWQQGVVWPSGRPLQAMCCAPALGFGPRHVDPAPVLEHSCGIHAWKRPEHVQRAPLDWVVYGEVNLWGRVIDCDRGWRAQYAYPRRLWAAPRHVERLRRYFPSVPVLPDETAAVGRRDDRREVDLGRHRQAAA